MYKRIKFVILFLLLSGYLPSSASSFFKLLSDTTHSNTLEGVIRLHNGSYLTYGSMYVQSISHLYPTYCKLDSVGNLIWQKQIIYGSMFNALVINAAVELPSGELMLFSDHYGSGNIQGSFVTKTDSSGNVLWEKSLNIGNYFAQNIENAILSADTNILLGMQTELNNSYYWKQEIYKVDTSGQVLWNSGFNSVQGTDDSLNTFQQGADGSIYLIADRAMTFEGQTQPALSKMDGSGNVLWSQTYTFPDTSIHSRFTDMLIMPSGNLLVCGSGEMIPNNKFLFVFEADTSGNLIWQQNYQYTNQSLVPHCLSLDSIQRICINGIVSNVYNLGFNMTIDSIGSNFTSTIFNYQFVQGSHTFTNPTHNFDLIAYNKYKPIQTTWMLIKMDSIDAPCNTQPFGIFPLLLPMLNHVYDSVYTYNFFINTFMLPINTYSTNIIYDGCTYTGLSETVAANPLVISPNPFCDVITFKTNDQTPKVVFIYDVTGKEIFKKEFIESLMVDTENFQKGMYIYKMIDDIGSVQSGKIIKD